MTTLAKDSARDYELGDLNDLPVVASDIIYEGAAVGDNASGYARPLVAADPFLGMATKEADNSAGAAGDINVNVKERGKIVVDVTGVTGVGDVGSPVYASDDDTFTLTAAGNSAIGKVVRFISGTKVVVAFKASKLQASIADVTGTADGTYDANEVTLINDLKAAVNSALSALEAAGIILAA